MESEQEGFMHAVSMYTASVIHLSRHCNAQRSWTPKMHCTYFKRGFQVMNGLFLEE